MRIESQEINQFVEKEQAKEHASIISWIWIHKYDTPFESMQKNEKKIVQQYAEQVHSFPIFGLW